jgi:hypothetical protein
MEATGARAHNSTEPTLGPWLALFLAPVPLDRRLR